MRKVTRQYQGLTVAIARVRAAAATVARGDWSRLFRMLDDDQSGSLRVEEMLKGVRETFGVRPGELPDSAVHELFAVMDPDASGEVDLDEFIHFLRKGKMPAGKNALNVTIR